MIAASLTVSNYAATSLASPFDHFGETFRSIAPPMVGAGSFGVVVDALPDGRLVAVTGNEILVEPSSGAGDFLIAATIDASLLDGPTDPAFIAVSPTGFRLAIGAGFGKPILIVDAAILNPANPVLLTPANTARFFVDHFDGSWLSDEALAVSFGAFGAPASISLLDVTSDPAAPVNQIIVFNIGGASAGVGFDAAGNLYTGNGFDNSPNTPGTSETGWIKRFTTEEWTAGANFESQGVLVGDLLSAGALRFDDHGDLFVGGGDFRSGDFGTLAIIRNEALTQSMNTGLPVDESDETQVKRIDPLGNGAGFYSAAFNRATGELLITDFAGWFATSGRQPGDLNGDAVVNGADLAAILSNFTSDDVFADLNADGTVDGADLAMLLANWGADSR